MQRSIALAVILTVSSPFVAGSAEPNVAPPRTNAIRSSQGFSASGIVGDNKTQAERDIEQYEKVVKLSDDQKRRIKEIYDARDKELKEYQATMNEKLPAQQAAMNEAVKSGNQAAIAEARKQFTTLFAPQQEIVKRGAEKLKGVLTPEQKEKVQEHRFRTTIAAYAPGAELTEAQINLLRIASTTGSGELEGYEGVLHELLNKTLTPEQAKTVLKHRVSQLLAATFRNVDFTPEQQSKIDAQIALMLENHPRAMHLDGVVYQKLQAFINQLLTAEQKEAMQRPRAG